MCLLCIEIAKGSLNWWEALRNYGEMVESTNKEHRREIESLIKQQVRKWRRENGFPG